MLILEKGKVTKFDIISEEDLEQNNPTLKSILKVEKLLKEKIYSKNQILKY